MDQVNALLENALRFLTDLGGMIIAVVVETELWMRDVLTSFGVPPTVQTGILIGFAVLLMFAGSRLLGGVIRLAFVLLILTVAIHILVPAMLN